MAKPQLIQINPNAEVRLHEIEDGRYCAIVDDVLEDPDTLVSYAVDRADEFTWLKGPPGPRLVLPDEALTDLHRLVKSRLSRHFPIFRSGIELRACLSNVTMAPEELGELQRMCHIDRRMSLDTHTYAGLIYLFRNEDLGGTAFYRWKNPDVIKEAERLFASDPAASMKYLEDASEVFRGTPRYMTESNDLAELLTVVPPRYNRLVFYNGEAPHSGHIVNPQLLTDDLTTGRLTFNFFASVHPQ